MQQGGGGGGSCPAPRRGSFACATHTRCPPAPLPPPAPAQTTVAVKILGGDKAPGATDVEHQRAVAKQLRNEASLMSKLRHTNVVLYMGACAEPPCLLVRPGRGPRSAPGCTVVPLQGWRVPILPD